MGICLYFFILLETVFVLEYRNYPAIFCYCNILVVRTGLYQKEMVGVLLVYPCRIYVPLRSHIIGNRPVPVWQENQC